MNIYDQPTTVNDDCRHKQADHLHGTHACYVLDRCRCDDCTRANARYERSRIKWLAGVVPHPMVDAEPARQHLLQFVGSGMSTKRIAHLTGVSNGTIGKLIYGVPNIGRPPSKLIRRETAEKLLACPYSVSDGARVPSGEAKRIVRELVKRGWSKAEIGRRVTGPHAKSLQAVRSREVQAGTLRTLRRLLEEPVPERTHPTGSTYKVDTGHRWRTIEPNTPGVPAEGPRLQTRHEPDRTPAASFPGAKGKLRCEVCSEPLAGHPIGAHRLGLVSRL